ncbi:MAG: multicopper oxidase domain-containing protein, partial [Deltaproteobacteria bacterium]|nr:multicopper oxidase domain-containing protein [Deltaproteobacteria bacterium]
MSTEKKSKRGRGLGALVMGLQRREFLKLSGAAGVTAALPFSRWVAKARAEGLIYGLSDPAGQPKFMEPVPNALDPGFIYDTSKGKIKVAVGPTVQETGLVDAAGNRLSTPLWGYGSDKFYTWPGRTFEVRSGEPLEVKWENRLTGLPYLITNLEGESVIDTSLHWAYSLHGYEDFSIDDNGTPLVMHLHGGHTDYQFDGNPEFFFSPGWAIRGPQWVEKKYVYLNDQPAGNLWYHDHALGLTRLNVYTGMAGFYFVRDDVDTGAPDNPLGLPAYPYELAYAIQDRMFKDN